MNILQLYLFRSAYEHYPESIDHIVVDPRDIQGLRGALELCRLLSEQ